MNRIARAAGVLVVLMFVSSGAFATDYYVPDDYSTIQAALDAVAAGNTIIVRDGTYTGADNKNLDFDGKAITLKSESGPANCTIDCENSGRGFTFEGSETSSTIVDGFTITKGEMNGSFPDNLGGGIYCITGSPTIKNCVITDNTASANGGGVYIWHCSPTVTNCVIENNNGYSGAGIGMSDQNFTATISNCIIRNNTASFRGGGIDCAGTPMITNCTIVWNEADYGAGLNINQEGAAAAIYNTSICENTAEYYGGGLTCQWGTSATLTNCILWDNTAPTGPELYQSNNANPSTVNVSYCDVEGGQAAAFVDTGCTLNWGSGNVDSLPLFLTVDDFTLSSASPCVDTGIDLGIYTDIHGAMRPYGGGYDMGSDEHTYDSVGVHRGRWWYCDSNGTRQWDSGTDVFYPFGLVTDIPITGDWNGDGFDEAGFFRDAWWYLDVDGDGLWGSGDVSFKFGQITDTPVTGDWNGDGTDDVGLFRNGWWFLDSNGDQQWNVAQDSYFKFGLATDIPVVGNWDGDGDDDVGVFRYRWWFLDSDGNQQWNVALDSYFKYGRATDVPVVGSWDGDNDDEVGVFRERWWYLDSNANDMWDVGVDASFKFGLATDAPLAGDW